MDILYLLPILFLIVALLYSMVGFGGGSSYIAILLAFGMAVDELRILALLCNIAVVLVASVRYYKADLILWRKVLPIVIFSIPAAYLGAKIQVEDQLYNVITGLILLAASLLMVVRKTKLKRKQRQSENAMFLAMAGIGIGFLSGFVGIGGGIFLSPLLFLMNWGKAKEISAMCSVFILVNSLSGITGHIENYYLLDTKLTISLIFSVIIGGLIGNRLNIKQLKPQYIRIFSAILIGYVGIRLLILQ